MVDKQRPRLCGPTENCLVETLLKWFSSGSGRDADVPSEEGVHVHCKDKRSAYFIFIDSVDKLAKVI